MAITLQESFERCCRLCAEQQEVTIMIFSDEAKAMLLKNKLNKYLLIEVDEDDRLPKNICIRCCTKLNNVCEFIDTAHKSQELLQTRSLYLERVTSENLMTATCLITNADGIKSEPLSEELDNNKVTEMEINVDPMMVLQNSEETMSPNPNEIQLQNSDERVIFLNGVDGENVTIKLIKANLKPFPCGTCKRSFNTELALKNHSWVHSKEQNKNALYNCSTCDTRYEYKSDLIIHLKEHRKNGKCQICGRISESNLTAHMACHSVGKAFACKICGRSYHTKSNLRTHSISHSNDRPYQCHLCKKGFKRNQDLKFHINQHTGDRPYKCPFCDKCFASSGNCYSHRSRMHPGRHVEGKVRRRPAGSQSLDKQLRAVAPKIPVVKGIFKYQCQLCEHSFLKRDNFTYHMYQHTGEKPYHCSFCPEKFVTRRGLLLHHDKTHSAKDRPLALISKNALLK